MPRTAEAQTSFQSHTFWKISVHVRGRRRTRRTRIEVILTLLHHEGNEALQKQVKVKALYSTENMVAMAAFAAPLAGVTQIEIERRIKELASQVSQELKPTTD